MGKDKLAEGGDAEAYGIRVNGGDVTVKLTDKISFQRVFGSEWYWAELVLVRVATAAMAATLLLMASKSWRCRPFRLAEHRDQVI
ncbi:MAG: hypothetical protein ACLR2G_14025 [Phascolarctobacterium faecium]